LLPAPTVPSRPVPPRQAFRNGRFRGAVTRTGSWPRILRSPSKAEAFSGFPAGSPSGPKPWRFAARRIRNSRSSSLPWRFRRPKPLHPRPAGSSAEALVPPDMAMSRSPGSMPDSQLPGRNPVLPDPSGTEVPSEPVAARLSEDIAFCRAGPGSWDPVSCLGRSSGPKAFGPAPVPNSPEGVSVPDGRFPKPAATAYAEGQARPRPHRGGFVSRPAVRFSRSPIRRRDQTSAWAVAGKAHLRCRRIVSATSGSCHVIRVAPSVIRLWITRITCITRGPHFPPPTGSPGRARPGQRRIESVATGSWTTPIADGRRLREWAARGRSQ
jgi:hypothetical protein